MPGFPLPPSESSLAKLTIDAIALLRELEHGGRLDDGRPGCPLCLHVRHNLEQTHAPDCRLAAILANQRTVEILRNAERDLLHRCKLLMRDAGVSKFVMERQTVDVKSLTAERERGQLSHDARQFIEQTWEEHEDTWVLRTRMAVIAPEGKAAAENDGT